MVTPWAVANSSPVAPMQQNNTAEPLGSSSRPVILLPSFVMEGRVMKHSGRVEAQHRHCQRLTVKHRAQRVRGQAGLVGRDGWGKARFLLCCEVNATVFTLRSSGTLAAKRLADPGDGGTSQARQAPLRGAEGTVPGPAVSPAGCPGGVTCLGWQLLALTLLCMKTTRWH